MSDGWAPGDLALCVDDGTRPVTFDGDVGRLKRGKTYTVTDLFCDGCGLYLAEMPSVNPAGWSADRFRKILPDKNRIKRKVSA